MLTPVPLVVIHKSNSIDLTRFIHHLWLAAVKFHRIRLYSYFYFLEKSGYNKCIHWLLLAIVCYIAFLQKVALSYSYFSLNSNILSTYVNKFSNKNKQLYSIYNPNLGWKTLSVDGMRPQTPISSNFLYFKIKFHLWNLEQSLTSGISWLMLEKVSHVLMYLLRELVWFPKLIH